MQSLHSHNKLENVKYHIYCKNTYTLSSANFVYELGLLADCPLMQTAQFCSHLRPIITYQLRPF